MLVSFIAASFLAQVADKLARCVDEVKLVADEKQLQNDEACKDTCGQKFGESEKLSSTPPKR